MTEFLIWVICLLDSVFQTSIQNPASAIQTHAAGSRYETLDSLHCCFGQDMSSSMRGCTVVWAQEGKEILIYVAVTVFHRELSGHHLLPILYPLRLCLHWSEPNETTVSGSDSEWCMYPSCKCRSTDCRSAQIG